MTSKIAVIYARFSSAKQTEQSIEGQLRVCHKYALENGYTIIKEYIDRAKTARNDLRPSFQRMLADSYKQKFDAVIVYALDRFARDDGDHGTDKRILQRNGVLLLSATQQIGINADGTENLGGILTEGIYVALAKYYSRELSQKIRRGQIESLEKKNSLGSLPPYGYYVENKKYRINPDQAPIVTEIFNKYATGQTAQQISESLCARKILNARGKPFTTSGVIKMLHNKKYVGIFEFGGKIYNDYLPPIITSSVFDKVQTRLALNKKAPARSKARERYLLSGKLYCGHCKSPMIGESGTGKCGETYLYYKCSTKKRRLTCEKTTLKKQALEDLVVSETIKNIFDPKNAKIIIDQVMALQEERNQNNELNLLKQQLVSVQSFINNILTAIKCGIITESTRDELENLERERRDLNNQIAIKESERGIVLDRSHVEFWFERFANITQYDEDTKLHLITYFVRAVIAYNDKIIIIYNHPGDNTSTIEKDELSALFEQTEFGFVSRPCTTKNTVSSRHGIFCAHQGAAYPMLQHTGCAIFDGKTVKN